MYKKKLIVLSTVAGILALICILGFIFTPERRVSRRSIFNWLDSKLVSKVDKISIVKPGEDLDTVDIVRRNNTWFVNYNGVDYPTKQLRVREFINLFTKRALYPMRSNTVASHERLGLTEESAYRVIFSTGQETDLLDLMMGYGGFYEKDIFLRKYKENKVYSGQDVFSPYIYSGRPSWYNLRLIPESENGKISLVNVQRLSVYNILEDGSEAPWVFTRKGKEWDISGLDLVNPNMEMIDYVVNELVNAEGDDFVYDVGIDDPSVNVIRFVIELGNGDIKTISLSKVVDDDYRRYAKISGSNFVYSLPGWVAGRFVRNESFFERQE